jgi:hypothetical protein
MGLFGLAKRKPSVHDDGQYLNGQDPEPEVGSIVMEYPKSCNKRVWMSVVFPTGEKTWASSDYVSCSNPRHAPDSVIFTRNWKDIQKPVEVIWLASNGA